MDQIEIICNEIVKTYNPYYPQFLEDNDAEKYANFFANSYGQIIRPVVTYHFPERYENIIEKYKEEIKNTIMSNPENIYGNAITLVFRKKYS